MANPISNDDDYDTPDHIDIDDSLQSKDVDYDDDDVLDSDIVSDDRVDNSMMNSTDGPSATPVITEEDFDRITTDDNGEL